jgi:hypothetical protein
MAESNLASHLAAVDPHTQYIEKDVAPNKGDIVVGLGNGLVGSHTIDVAGYVLFADPNSPKGTGLLWLPFDAVRASLLRHKGDIVTSDGRGNIVVVPAGTAGEVLMPNSSVPGGLEWVEWVDVCPTRLDFTYDCDSQYVPVVL